MASRLRFIAPAWAHVAYGVVQSGLTCGVASAITTWQTAGSQPFLPMWLASWALAWVCMLPVVVFAAPLIRRLVQALVRGEQA